MEWSRFLTLPLAACMTLVLLTGCASKLETYRKQGLAQYKQEQLEQSRESFNKALQEDQADPVSNSYVGLLDYRANHLEQAEYHFRVALALDPSSEEAKAGLAVTLINRQQIAPEHFVEREGGAVEFSDAGRKLVIKAYQERKQETLKHPLLDQTLRLAQMPHIQARILARHLRGDILEYVPLVPK